MPRTLPLLVLVAGAPASGKTTLARCLADALPLPLLSRDPIREILADAMSVEVVQGQSFAVPSFRVFLALIAELLAAGVGLVAESNFFRGESEDHLRPLVQLSRKVLIHCDPPREVSIGRFVERFEQGGERHWSSSERHRIAQLQAGELSDAWQRAEPLDLRVPTLCVDTTDGYAPDLEATVTFVRSAATG